MTARPDLPRVLDYGIPLPEAPMSSPLHFFLRSKEKRDAFPKRIGDRGEGLRFFVESSSSFKE